MNEKQVPRCQAKVYKREQLRRTGRGPSGFERHYTEEQCTRRATHSDLCCQHAKTPNMSRANYHEFMR